MLRFWLTRPERSLITALADGYTLKSHRELSGDKRYTLYPPSDQTGETPQEVPYDRVQSLLDRKLITTNQKFPAATFLLTNKGQRISRRRLRGIGSVVHFDG